jgi:hypothetical protein
MAKDERWERHESLSAQEFQEPAAAEATKPKQVPSAPEPEKDPVSDKTITLQSSDSFSEQLIKAKASVGSRFEKFGNLKIATYQGSKTIAEWGKEFHVAIPEDGDPEAIIGAGAKAASLYGAAITNFEQASITNLTLKKELEAKEGELFSKIKRLKENGKAPSDRSVQARVASHPEIIRLNNQLAISDFIVKFWDNKKQQLVYLRRTLEMIGYAKGAEMKSLHHNASVPRTF